MKKLFFLLFFLLSNISFSAEIIDNVSKQENKFGDWVVVCEEDIMLENVECKVFSQFYNENSFIYVQPNNKIANQVVIMIPSAKIGTKLKFKVDKNPLISSDEIVASRYGLIPFSPAKQKTMLNQIKTGEILYLRFTINDSKGFNGEREITAKISLAEFPKLLIHYDMKMNNNK